MKGKCMKQGKESTEKPLKKKSQEPTKEPVRDRGIFEEIKGSGKWYIRYTGADGKRHKETAGRHGDAIDLLAKRLHDKLLEKKLPDEVTVANSSGVRSR